MPMYPIMTRFGTARLATLLVGLGLPGLVLMPGGMDAQTAPVKPQRAAQRLVARQALGQRLFF
jgi:hypothetical protein